MQKPELLVPVGNVESFYAALKGGANAVYLGTKHFNARERAANFSLTQLLQIIDEAQKNHVKVYITLNTVIKNHELDELLDILWFLSKTKVSAIIVQDWGTFYLTRRFFPHLTIHASTQMANHNSAGTGFSKKKWGLHVSSFPGNLPGASWKPSRKIHLSKLKYLYMEPFAILFRGCAFSAVIWVAPGQTVVYAHNPAGGFTKMTIPNGCFSA